MAYERALNLAFLMKPNESPSLRFEASRDGVTSGEVSLPGRLIRERRGGARAVGGGRWLVTDLAMLGLAAISAVLSQPELGYGNMLVFSVLVVVNLFAKRLYAPGSRLSAADDSFNIVRAVALAALISLAARNIFEQTLYAVEETTLLAGFAVAYLTAGRTTVFALQKRARMHGNGVRPTLIIGAGRIGHLAAKRLLDRPGLGLRPVGFLDRRPLAAERGETLLPVLGASWDLDDVIAEHGIEAVIVTFSTAPHDVMLRLVRRCWELGIDVSIVPRLFEVEGSRVGVDHIGGLPLIRLQTSAAASWQRTAKEVCDRVGALVLLVLLLPLFAVVAVAVRASMGAPLFHVAPRLGRDGNVFRMLKFRTMTGTPEGAGESDAGWAEQMLAAVHPFDTRRPPEPHPSRTNGLNGVPNGNGHASDGGAPTVTRLAIPEVAQRRESEQLHRVTRLGSILRAASVDELPQLWNVVRGDMSLVGPRPERVHYAESFQDTIYRYEDRHRMKSGLTGWAQVHGLRGRTSLADRVEWDNYYIENWSLLLDVKILMMTVLMFARRSD